MRNFDECQKSMRSSLAWMVRLSVVLDPHAGAGADSCYRRSKLQAVIKRGFGATLAITALAIGFTSPEREGVYAQGGGADTHGRDATPDYGRVFVQERVSRLDLKIAASDWQSW